MSLAAELSRIANARTSRVIGTPATTAERSGYLYVTEDPFSLAQSAGLDLDTYALARAVASETSGSAAQLLAVAEAIRNAAAEKGRSVFAQVTRDRSHPFADKLFGEQAGRFVSSRQNPRGQHVEAAMVALDLGTRLARDAVRFISPKTHDSGVQRGRSIPSAEEIIRSRASEGLLWVGPIEGIDEYDLMLLSRQAKREPTEALAAIAPKRPTVVASRETIVLPEIEITGNVGVPTREEQTEPAATLILAAVAAVSL